MPRMFMLMSVRFVLMRMGIFMLMRMQMLVGMRMLVSMFTTHNNPPFSDLDCLLH